MIEIVVRMDRRRVIAGMLPTALLAVMSAFGASRVSRQTPSPGLYDAQPNHIWNRVHRALHVRVAQDGQEYGEDEIDPLLWRETTFLLTGPSHSKAIRLLDEFLNAHAERLITEPLKRAIFQHDLWAIFDWLAANSQNYPAERRALASRLARVIRRVALRRDQITGLPDNYSGAVASRAFSDRYDPEHPDTAFLPPDLLDARGTWTAISAAHENYEGAEPFVRQHSAEASQSAFAVFLRLPGGQEATRNYLKTLWDFPQPYVADPFFSLAEQRELRAMLNPALPQLPLATQMALVRKMLLIDDTGVIVRSHVIESVQIRVFHARSPRARPEQHRLTGDQDFFEFRTTRRQLFARPSGALHAVKKTDEGFITFSAMDMDQFEPRETPVRRLGASILNGCVNCHEEEGILSVRSVGRLLKPYSLFDDHNAREQVGALWKTRRSDWALLQALWESNPR